MATNDLDLYFQEQREKTAQQKQIEALNLKLEALSQQLVKQANEFEAQLAQIKLKLNNRITSFKKHQDRYKQVIDARKLKASLALKAYYAGKDPRTLKQIAEDCNLTIGQLNRLKAKLKNNL